jgi:hypothetical protein
MVTLHPAIAELVRSGHVRVGRGLRDGERVSVSYRGVTATGTVHCWTSGTHLQVRLDGTDQIVSVPESIVCRLAD